MLNIEPFRTVVKGNIRIFKVLICFIHVIVSRLFSCPMASSVSKAAMSMRKLVVKQLSTNFRSATEVVTAPIPKPGIAEVLVRNRLESKGLGWLICNSGCVPTDA